MGWCMGWCKQRVVHEVVHRVWTGWCIGCGWGGVHHAHHPMIGCGCGSAQGVDGVVNGWKRGVYMGWCMGCTSTTPVSYC